MNGTGLHAANQFYILLRAKHPVARARWREILMLASQGDLEAIRAVRLMQSVMANSGPGYAGVQIGQVPAARMAITPTQIEALRLVLVQARNAPPLAGQAGG